MRKHFTRMYAGPSLNQTPLPLSFPIPFLSSFSISPSLLFLYFSSFLRFICNSTYLRFNALNLPLSVNFFTSLCLSFSKLSVIVKNSSFFRNYEGMLLGIPYIFSLLSLLRSPFFFFFPSSFYVFNQTHFLLHLRLSLIHLINNCLFNISALGRQNM